MTSRVSATSMYPVNTSRCPNIFMMARWKGVCMRICMQRIKRVDVPKAVSYTHLTLPTTSRV